ncbi:hypothetical protein CXB51_004891 [Gossypium anomalum]|uniref:Uncharacterized protein n=1 Tax=Gossypium anomalum TaxID=47600 RepID=A0A8J5ZB68_9ROSI|nr:hypothetical protein CXB51_004891 [Gossypium anomalum]
MEGHRLFHAIASGADPQRTQPRNKMKIFYCCLPLHISRRRGSVAWSSARLGSLVRVVLCLDSKLVAPISFCC